MSEFWNLHELSNLQVAIYVAQFFCLGAILGVLIGSRNGIRKKNK